MLCVFCWSCQVRAKVNKILGRIVCDGAIGSVVEVIAESRLTNLGAKNCFVLNVSVCPQSNPVEGFYSLSKRLPVIILPEGPKFQSVARSQNPLMEFNGAISKGWLFGKRLTCIHRANCLRLNEASWRRAEVFDLPPIVGRETGSNDAPALSDRRDHEPSSLRSDRVIRLLERRFRCLASLASLLGNNQESEENGPYGSSLPANGRH